jgi:hypothetical protein
MRAGSIVAGKYVGVPDGGILYVGDDPLDFLDPLGLDKASPPKTNFDCVKEAVMKNSASLLLYAASLLLDAADGGEGGGGDALKLLLIQAVSATAFANSLIGKQFLSSVTTVIGSQVLLTDGAAKREGASWAGAIPQGKHGA